MSVTAARIPIQDRRGTATALSPLPNVKPLARMPTAKSSGTCSPAEMARVTGVMNLMTDLEKAVISCARGSTHGFG